MKGLHPNLVVCEHVVLACGHCLLIHAAPLLNASAIHRLIALLTVHLLTTII